MLSYRHAFHAGNLADVHKHAALAAMLTLLQRKARGYCYVDTHAGAGRYLLEERSERAEWVDGIAKVLARAKSAPAGLSPYLQAVAQGEEGHYPGSPWLAAQLARAQDRSLLFELHPQDGKALKTLFKGDRRVAVHAPRDAREGLPALLPPSTPRGLVLIDPSYERLEEYQEAAALMAVAQARWPTAAVAVWYPVLGGARAGRHDVLLNEVRARDMAGPVLRSELHARDGGLGRLAGSGLLVAKPPWPFAEQWPEANAWLANTLAEPASVAMARDEWLIPERAGSA